MIMTQEHFITDENSLYQIEPSVQHDAVPNTYVKPIEYLGIHILNLARYKPTTAWCFKVDRTTPLGNIFYMKDESERKDVCTKYHEHFYTNIISAWTARPANLYLKELLAAYCKYGKLNLYCWCAPKQCHANTIKEWILKAFEKA